MAKKTDRGFCPFMSVERSDGHINKVDCSKKCALFIEDVGRCTFLVPNESVGLRLTNIQNSLDKIYELYSRQFLI